MKKATILLVEDDSTLSFIIEDALNREGFSVVTAINGEDGLAKFESSSPALVIADVMMPKMDGFQMVKRIRLKEPNLPILFLTARTSIDDVVKGFEIGANDYLRKPFQLIELVVRIKSLLNRAKQKRHEDKLITLGDCTLNFSSQHLIIGKNDIELTHIEAVILYELFSRPDEVVETRTLMLRIWNNDDYNNLNRLHGFIHKLRKHLSKSTSLDILNARGIGYKLTTSA